MWYRTLLILMVFAILAVSFCLLPDNSSHTVCSGNWHAVVKPSLIGPMQSVVPSVSANEIRLSPVKFQFNKKVTIFSHHYNRSDFIELQFHSLQTFLVDDFELIVFNDAKETGDVLNFQDANVKAKIEETCKSLGIRCIRIPQEIHTRPYLTRRPGEDFNHPCCRCANVVQWSLDEYGFDAPGLLAILDSDMFLVKEFNMQTFMQNTDISGVPQSRAYETDVIEYVWNGLVIFNMDTLPNKTAINFNCGIIKNLPVDVGGYMHHYFTDNPSVKWTKIPQQNFANFSESDFEMINNTPLGNLIHEDAKLNSNSKSNIELFMYTFLHYRGGGNWDYKSHDYHQQKTQLFRTFLTQISV